MGTTPSTFQKISFEDVQYALRTPENYLFINTLGENDQTCLLPKTVVANQEEIVMNRLLQKGKKDIHVIIYGKNCNDERIYKKYSQLLSLGFFNVYLYPGGLFEWLLLQDIYGNKEFVTTQTEHDLLKYKPNKIFGVSLLEYID